jgi:hypothetical protein
VLSQHVYELETNRIAERLGDARHPLGLFGFDVGIDDRLTARLAGGALYLRGELHVDAHKLMNID